MARVDGDEQTDVSTSPRGIPAEITKGADHVSLRVLLYEYKKTLRELRRAYKEADCVYTLDHQLKTDRSIIASMISDLEFVIQWIETGKNPDSRRGADKTEVYLTDPFLLERLEYGPMYQVPVREIGQVDKEKMVDALSILSKREKEIFILAKGEMLSYEAIAELLGIKKSTVQTHMERAERKIERRKQESLFLVM